MGLWDCRVPKVLFWIRSQDYQKHTPAGRHTHTSPRCKKKSYSHEHVHSHQSNNRKYSLLCDRNKLSDCHIFSKMLTKAKNLFNPIKYLKALLVKVSVLGYFISG